MVVTWYFNAGLPYYGSHVLNSPITSALLVACDISDRLIWSPSMNYEPGSAARRVAVGRSGARGELNVRLKHN